MRGGHRWAGSRHCRESGLLVGVTRKNGVEIYDGSNLSTVVFPSGC